MERYINPGKEQFVRFLKKYVDKTGIISLFDDALDSEESLVMVG